MKVHFRMWGAAAVLVLIACGCTVSPGRIVHLNDPLRSQPVRDVANLFSPRDVPYEIIEHDGVSVGYNLFFAKNATVSGYRLTLILKNGTHLERRLEPLVRLQDDAGTLIRPYSYQAFVAKAASLAGTVVPPPPFSCQCSSHYSAGTVQTGIDTEDGASRGSASNGANDREGLLMLLWAESFWLKEAYDLPPGEVSWGALFFPAAALGKLPMHLTVMLGAQKYEFDSVATTGDR